jgi:acetamidase/formamidase
VTILHTGQGPILSANYLPSTRENIIWGRIPCELDEPVLEVDSGSDVTIDTISHEGILEDQGRDPLAFFTGYGVAADAVLDDAISLAASDYRRTPGPDGPHVITGPVAVRGAKPGDLLKITVLDLAQRVPYGIISNRHGRGALPGEYPEGPDTVSIFSGVEVAADGSERGVLARTAAGGRVSFPLAPFIGIMGVAVAGEERPSSVPPGAHGGNIDINLLTVGSSLYLPVQVPGALAYLGDPHFAQGDGEVALTAMEASLRATVRFEVLDSADAVKEFGELAGPLGETAEFLIPTGLSVDLDEAMQNCVRAAIGLLGARFGMDSAHAYAYLSAATDFNISQVVDLVKGVHARIRVADFDE